MVPTKKLFENELYINKIIKLLDSLDIVPNEFNNY